ncbi:replication endonuclease [Acerihabitans sp. TG2]|uniref:replication endonuclease n=1 Tax=Acerihabitans sp. TG2 TaxID=3096008 RepID=UPI002B221E83|nr:replication endonuclease [Acerihabitans sp. TG2]MEA9393158.1 replication endonuclease [Acerihabitans sp. TG2]
MNYISREIRDSLTGEVVYFSKPLCGESLSSPNTLHMPNNISIYEQRLWDLNKEDHQWRSQYLSVMPNFLGRYFADRYTKIFTHKGRRFANDFLRTSLGENILPRLKIVLDRYNLSGKGEFSEYFRKDFAPSRLPNLGRSEVKKLSYRVADYLHQCFVKFTDQFSETGTQQHNSLVQISYRYLAGLLQEINVPVPYWNSVKENAICENKAISAITRMTSPVWWKNKLQRRRDMQREHMAIAVGQVQKSASAYVSQSCLAEWKEQKTRNREMLKALELENQETGERVPLIDMVARSNANPAIRRCELMVRMRGFEDIADELGCVGDFFTLTAPSKFHSAHSAGGFVKNWIGTDPRECQQYLCAVWACARAKLKRQGLPIFGFRVAEPHHDGMPHWHMLLFMLPEHRDRIRHILREYALKIDGNEPGAIEHRLKVKEIDRTKGTATGYIAKYISKNIDGYALENEKDEESGEDLRTMAKAVTAWASRWRIRQFQQIGGAPVTVWRELRRLRNIELSDPKMDAVLAAADLGDWAAYTALQGGPLILRKDLVVRLNYRTDDCPNLYGEEVKRISGVMSPLIGDSSIIATRLNKWKIVSKATSADQREAAVSGRTAAPWSSVNNCTAGYRAKLSKLLVGRGLEGSNYEIDILMRGSNIVLSDGVLLKVADGQCIEMRTNYWW